MSASAWERRLPFLRADDPPDVKALLWDPPRLNSSPDKKVGWMELFEDLLYVAIIAQLSGIVEAGLLEESEEQDTAFGLSPASSALVSFSVFGVVAWVLWSNKTFYTSRTEGGADAFGLCLDVLGMLGLVFMAANMKGLHNHRATANLCLAVSVVNLSLLLKYLRLVHHHPDLRAPFRGPMMFFGACSAGYFVLSYINDSDLRALLFSAEFWLSLMMVRGGRIRKIRAASDFYGERYGLLMLLAFGEVVAVVSEAEVGTERSWSSLVGTVMGFLCVYSVFQGYFQREADGEVLFSSVKGLVLFTLVHVPLVLGTTAMAGALSALLELWELEPDEPVAVHVRVVACTSLATVMISQGLLNVLLRHREQVEAGVASAARTRKMVFFVFVVPTFVVVLGCLHGWKPSALVLLLFLVLMLSMAFSSWLFVIKRRGIEAAASGGTEPLLQDSAPDSYLDQALACARALEGPEAPRLVALLEAAARSES